MGKRSFIKGAAILAGAGLVAKVIGAVFRIPLTYIVRTEGMGLYQMAYPIYAFLLVASTAGLPVAISKMVAERIALKNYREAHRVFRVALALLAGIGLCTSLILFSGSRLIAGLVGNERAVYPLMAISPALFFVSLLSAYRGYFQGMQIMYPTALSQIVEQMGKLVLGLLLASLWIERGAEYGAAGAILGVTLSEIAALVLMLGIYRRKRSYIREMSSRAKNAAGRCEPAKEIVFWLIKIAVPVTVGASIIPLVGLADEAIVVNRLKGIINLVTGRFYTEVEATKLYGLLTGVVNPLINFPAIFTIALGMSLVPSVSESYVLRDRKNISRKALTGIRLTLLVGLPAAVGMWVLAEPIIRFLYRTLEEWEYTCAGSILRTLSTGIIFLTLIQSLTAILQGVNRVTLPVRNLFIGALFKIAVTFILVGVPELNVRGAAIGTVTCYAVAASLDLAAVIRYTGIPLSLKDLFIRPLVASGGMGIAVYLIFKWGIRLWASNTRAVLLAILAGILVYGAMLLVTGAIRREDLELIPGGRKLERIFDIFGLLKK